MAGLELLLLLLAVSAALRVLAERLPVPYPTVLVVGGLALALVPDVPRVELSPEVLFLVFVPPLLYGGAWSFPLRDFRRALGPILRLAVLMVLVSMVAVAVVVHAVDPAFTWAAAFTLGAIVSPPDPVAVLALMRTLRMPRAIQSILEGEGMLNDATALVAYRVAVGAAVTGAFAPWRTALQFFAVTAGGVAVGLVVGAVLLRLRRLTRSVDVVENVVSLLTPYAAYLSAERVGASGVVAVVTAAMYTARLASDDGSAAMRLQNAAMWSVVTFLLESLSFILIGLELPYVTRELGRSSLAPLLREAALVCVCVVVVRLLWIFPSGYVGRAADRWVRGGRGSLGSWRELLFIGWAGIRGADSLVIALALPLTTAGGAAFPARDRILFLTFGVILTTLLLQGPTLLPLARRLGLHDDGRADGEEAHARLSAAEAGLLALDSPALSASTYPEVARFLRRRHRQRARRWASREAGRLEARANESPDAQHAQHAEHAHFVVAPSHDAGVLDERRAAEYRRVRAGMIQAEQRALRELRDRGEIGDDVMRGVQRELDLERVLLDSSAPVLEPPREAGAERG
jgi:CPA1 family monovalent cation:H+ antiporter